MRHPTRFNAAWMQASACAIVWLWVHTVAHACDAPVHEYALQNWERDAYQAYYFYMGREAPEDAAVNHFLEQVARGKVGCANLGFARVDVSKLSSPDAPQLYRRVWKRFDKVRPPFHAVLTPRGTTLFSGRIDLSMAKRLIDSPARQKIADELCQGKEGMLLVLLGPSQEENNRVRRVVKQVIAEVAEQGPDVAYMELMRTDAGEKELVSQLLNVEDDLADLNEAMVFGIFGRAHALEPYVGAGVTRGSVLELVAFMNGPCTCDVKAWNPGMDLLTSCDWGARVAGLPSLADEPLRSFLFDVADEGTDPQAAELEREARPTLQLQPLSPEAEPAGRQDSAAGAKRPSPAAASVPAQPSQTSTPATNRPHTAKRPSPKPQPEPAPKAAEHGPSEVEPEPAQEQPAEAASPEHIRQPAEPALSPELAQEAVALELHPPARRPSPTTAAALALIIAGVVVGLAGFFLTRRANRS